MKIDYSALRARLGAAWASFRTYLAAKLRAAHGAVQALLVRGLNHSYGSFCLTLTLMALSALLAKLADQVGEWGNEIAELVRSFPSKAVYDAKFKGTLGRR